MEDIKISQHDRCPACRKKIVNLVKDRGGILRAPCGAVVCSCGNCFFLKAMVGVALKQAKSPIIQPNQSDLKLVKSP